MLRGSMQPARRSVWILGLGAAAGLALATARLVWPPGGGAVATPDAVAVVNGVPIARADFDRAMAALGADRREGVRGGDHERVLERLVDEELLLQRALELGLPRRDPRVRGQLVATMIDTAIADARGVEPDAGELRDFYTAHRSYFARPGRVRVVHRAVAGDDGAARAEAVRVAAELRAGRLPPAGTAAATAPDALLPVSRLEHLLGPALAETLRTLPAGGVSEPVRAGGSYHVLRVEEREDGIVPPFEEIRDLVRAELVRRRGEAALRDYVDALRRDADVAASELGG